MSYQWLIVFLLFTILDTTICFQSVEWPVPYRRYDSRPPTNDYCQAQYPFCPTGRPPGDMPSVYDNDTIEVFALKAPVWEFKLGDLLAKLNIIHDALGFRNKRTGQNYTMEWYELFQLFNCTFGHVLDNSTAYWCNQGAACIYDGIQDKHWSENGTLAKIGEMTGAAWKQYSDWVREDNHTGIYYETWTVEESPGGKLWFDSFDCASWVLRALNKLGELGAKFDHSISLNYTRIHLYCDEPQYLGNETDIFGPSGSKKQYAKDILNFYKKFQSHQSLWQLLLHLVEGGGEVFLENKFYFFYNFEYWFLPMKAPHLKLTYLEIPLP